MTIKKTWEYRAFTPGGTYLGIIPNVETPFNYNQNIATTFVQIQFNVAQSADTAPQAVDPIDTEGGLSIQDESGNDLLIERQPDLVGDDNSAALIANDNLLQVWEFSDYYPNGTKVFDGYISKWKTIFGASDDVLVTAISNGNDLKDYLVPGSQYQSDQSQTSENSSNTLSPETGKANAAIAGESFTVGAAQANIGAIDCMLNGVGTVVMRLYNSVADRNAGNVLATSAQQTINLTTPTVVKFIFPDTTVTPGVQMCWDIYTISGTYPNYPSIYYQNSDVYANGVGYYVPAYGGFIGDFNFDSGTLLGGDYYFVTYSDTGASNAVFTNQDPAAIMQSIVDNYGGFVSSPAGGYANTGVTTSYTFKAQTMVAGIPTVLGLSPADWYWYVDPATNTLQFAKYNTVADINLVLGRHINQLEIEATKEGLKNVAYFTGGDDGTNTNTSIYVKVTNPQGSNRRGLAQLSDNRVNSATGGVTVAKQIAQNFLDSNASETYIAPIIIQDRTMDINLLKLGMMVGFGGFGNFVDRLLLPIVGVTKQGDQVTLQLGSLPPRPTQAISQIQASLSAQQTVNTPTTPS